MKSRPATTVLVVDDEEDLAEIVCEELQAAGFNTLMASSGNKALKVLESHSVDAVVSDIRMPDGDGLYLLETLRKKSVNFPIVLLMTGFAEVTYEEIFDKGAEGVFRKPLDFEALANSLHRLVEQEAPSSRRPLRFEVDQSVVLRFANIKEALKSRLINLGRGGAFIFSEDNSPLPGSLPSLTLIFDHGPLQQVEVEGVVRWTRKKTNPDLPPGFGMEFLDFSPGDRNKLLGYVNSLQTRSYIPLK